MRDALCSLLLACGLLWALGSAPSPAQSQSNAEFKALNVEITALYNAGKFAEALPLAKRVVDTIKARHGTGRPEYATALNLAQLLKQTNRLSEAEPLYRRAL